MADAEVAKKDEKAKVYVPTGKPRGRPPKKVGNRGAHLRVPDHLKKAKPVPTGKPRGRPPGPAAGRVVKKDTPKKGRGRPAKKVAEGGKGKKPKEDKVETEEEED